MHARTSSRRGVTRFVLPLAVVLGYAVPRFAIPSGVRAHRAEPLAHATAATAFEGAAQLNDHPLGRLLVPGARVTRVWREPGHCRDTRPPGPQAEYRAVVRTYAWFGLRGPEIDTQCGGWYVRTRS